jgi:quercetin dioxygenase-like cupin family protein
MLRIAAALELPLAELFAESETSAPCLLTPKGKGQIISRDGSRFGYCYEALALGMKNKSAEPFLLTIQPGDPVGRFRHGGEEFIYMLSGCMQFTVGNQAVRLRPGDSLYFDPRQEHRTQILGKKPARFLCLFIQKEERSLKKKVSHD